MDEISINKDGWYESNLFGSRQYLIFGADYFLFQDANNSWFSSFISSDSFLDSKEKLIDNKLYYCGAREKKISSIELPDVLTENLKGNKVVYNSYDMEHYFYRILDEVVYFNKDAVPWATSKNPKDMIISVNFYEPQDKLVILNGYVNPEKTYLYKDNRRLKKIRIFSEEEGKSFSFQCDLEDIVHFEKITLPNKVLNVKIEILDFYEGRKYKDLCVQMFGLEMDQNWYDYNVSYAEFKKEKYIPFSDIKNFTKYTNQSFLPKKRYWSKNK